MGVLAQCKECTEETRRTIRRQRGLQVCLDISMIGAFHEVAVVQSRVTRRVEAAAESTILT